MRHKRVVFQLKSLVRLLQDTYTKGERSSDGDDTMRAGSDFSVMRWLLSTKSDSRHAIVALLP